MNIAIELTNEKAKIPTKATSLSSCYDIFSCETIELKNLVTYGMFAGSCSTEIHKIKTGLKILLPKWFELIIRPRSSLAIKGIIIPNSPCTIDPGYSGEILIPMMNIGKDDYIIKEGDRIAQCTIQEVKTINFMTVSKDEYEEIHKEYNYTEDRNKGGFGSTGC